MHVNEEDLILHYYGELEAAGEAEAAAHLSECGACHASYTKLQRVLAAIDAAPAPELADGFERTVWARLEPDLSRPRDGWRSWFALSPGRFALAAGAVAILVTGAFFAGRVTHPDPGATVTRAAATSPFRERMLLADLG